MSRRVVLGLALAGVSAPAFGQTTYYVRKSGSNGADGLSPGAAFATIDYAADLAVAGDTVFVGAGTYSETVTPSNDGTVDSPIRFVADTSGAQTGDAGEVIIRRVGTSGNALVVDGDNYITFRGFIIEGGGDTVVWRSSVGGRLENCVIRGSFDDQIEVSSSSELAIRGCTITNVGDDAIDVKSGDVTVELTVLDNVTDNALYLSDSSGTLVARRCTVTNAGNGARATGGTMTVINCVIDGVSGMGVLGEGSAALEVINCTINDVGSDGVNTSGTATVINTCFTNITDDAMDLEAGTITASSNLIWVYGGSRSEGFDSTEYQFDPQYEDPGAGDFRLATGSGAIDIASDQSGFTTLDRLGTVRPAGAAWDLGAHEYTAPAVYASVPYVTDFESGAGAEWSDQTTSTLAALSQYLGRYGEQDGSSLHVNGMTPGETYYLYWDMYVIDNVEGSTFEEDYFAVTVNGSLVFYETLDNETGVQTYTGVPDQSGTNLGYGSHVDSTYSRIYVTFVADSTSAVIRWDADMSADISNESWGIDDVMVLHEDDVDAYLPIFTDVSSATGFDTANSGDMHSASGLHWADLDDDGDMDVVITGEASSVGVYDAVSDAFAITSIGSGQLVRQGALLDADLDGDLDFWASCDGSTNVEGLYENNWPASFSWRGASGVTDPSNNEGVTAGDFDGDGRPDLAMFSENGNWLLSNQGESPVSFDATNDSADGLHVGGAYGNGQFVSAADVNADGYPDFFYHYNGGVLFLSDGDGTWSVSGSAPVANTVNTQKAGSAWGDYDNDGDMDLYVPYRSGGGRLYQNSGGAFTNVAAAAGITDSDSQISASWGDFDNDGDLDLLIATGAGVDTLLYQNQGDGTFEWVDKGAAFPGDVHDVVFVDYDSDGDLDIAATVVDGTNVLLRNDTDDDAYLKVRLLWDIAGVETPAVGVRLELWDSTESSRLGVRHAGGARGFGGSEPVWAHFGGVDPATEYVVKVFWPGQDPESVSVTPSAVSTTFGAVTVAQMLTITGESSGVRVVRWREVGAVTDE